MKIKSSALPSYILFLFVDLLCAIVKRQALANFVTLSTVPRLTTSVEKADIYSFAFSPFEKLPSLQRLAVNANSALLQPIWRVADPDWNSIWDVSRAERGETLYLSNARLLIQQTVDDRHLLLKCERPFIMSSKPRNWEYTQENLDVQQREHLTRPIPVHLMWVQSQCYHEDMTGQYAIQDEDFPTSAQ